MKRSTEQRQRAIAQRIIWMKAAAREVSDSVEYFREHDTGDCVENDIAKSRAIDRIEAANERWHRHADKLDELMLADRVRQ